LTRREEALTTWEEKVKISEKAHVKVNADLDAEWEKAEATRKEYLNKMEVHTTCAKHSLGLDKMLGETKVELDGRERDLGLREAVLAEVQSHRINHLDNREGAPLPLAAFGEIRDSHCQKTLSRLPHHQESW
jgi:hypothetical protein